MQEIVIKIDDNLYTRLFNNGMFNHDEAVDMAKAIRKGTVLPKGHGRLIDAGKYIDVLNNAQIEGLNTYKGLGRAKELLIDTPTIIEADRSAK